MSLFRLRKFHIFVSNISREKKWIIIYRNYIGYLLKIRSLTPQRSHWCDLSWPWSWTKWESSFDFVGNSSEQNEHLISPFSAFTLVPSLSIWWTFIMWSNRCRLRMNLDWHSLQVHLPSCWCSVIKCESRSKVVSNLAGQDLHRVLSECFLLGLSWYFSVDFSLDFGGLFGVDFDALSGVDIGSPWLSILTILLPCLSIKCFSLMWRSWCRLWI